MSFSFEGKTALVTGAARGLGLAVAEELAARGARVIATDCDLGELERATARLLDGHPVCRVLPLDVTDEAGIDALRGRLNDEVGGLDVLVNNAGVVHGGAFLDLPLEHHRQLYRVNVEGLVAMTHAFLPDLIASPQGRLVNVASVSGFLALPWGTTYSSSKWAVVGFSEGVRLELAELGHRHVRVTTVCPSYIRTGMFEGIQTPRMTRVLSAAEVSHAVVRAAERGKRRLLLPAMAWAAPLGVGLPGWLSDFLSRRLGVTSTMKTWRGRGA